MSIYKNKISEADEEKITGGISQNMQPELSNPGTIDELPWEVVDDAYGKTLGRYATKEEAEKMAAIKQQSSNEIEPSLLQKLRESGQRRFGFGHKFHK